MSDTANKRGNLRRELLRKLLAADAAGAPLSPSQRHLWFVDRMGLCGAAYNMFQAFRLDGELDVISLEGAIQDLIERHDALRTRFGVVDDSPVQVVEPAIRLQVSFTDLCGDGDALARAGKLAADEAARPFSLDEAPLIRASLLRIAAPCHVLTLNVHHIVCDGWSLGVIARELPVLYAARRAGRHARVLPPPAMQYPAYARGQSGEISSDRQRAHREFWQGQLRDAARTLDLPSHTARPVVQSFCGERIDVELDGVLTAAIGHLAARCNTTVFNVLLAAFGVLLGRYSGQDEAVIGTPVANRHRRELESTVGFFVNTLPMRLKLDGRKSFRALLASVHATTRDALAHQELPIEEVVKDLRLSPDLSRNPLFQVVFSFQNYEPEPFALDGLEVRRFPVQIRSAKLDLLLSLQHGSDGCTGFLEYNTDLFASDAMHLMVRHLRVLLSSAVASPDQPVETLPILTDEERARLVMRGGDVNCDEPGATVVSRFAEQARRMPDAIAVIAAGDTLTYAELESRANRLARRLRGLGIGRESLVGLCIDRTVDLMVSVLGIMKSGGAYVPLDPTFPRDRLAFMMRDADIAVLVTSGDAAESLPPSVVARIDLGAERVSLSALDDSPPDHPPGPHQLAYVIYTSGSTGRPKGVRVEHASLINFALSVQIRCEVGPRDRLGSVASLSFDASVLDLYVPLLSGAAVVLIARDTARDGAALARTLADAGANMLHATPSTWQLLLAAGWDGRPALTALSGGEALPHALAVELCALCPSVWNLYGPTETTVYSTMSNLTRDLPDDHVGIGTPIAGTRIYVLGPGLQQVPAGVVGELCIAGDGVARDYLNRPTLTAERFVADPFVEQPGARLYRTGDLARFRADGTVECLGRSDHQVKLRGYRIELGEIESVLAGHAGIREAVVVLGDDHYGDPRLVSYVVPEVGSAVQLGELRAHLRAHVPAYMVPSELVVLERMPLSPNGKIDRAALPAPEGERQADALYMAPRTALEFRLAQIWRDVLGVERVGVQDSFFDLGGHSLLATRLTSRMRSVLGAEVPLMELFAHPSISELAERVERLVPETTDRVGRPLVIPRTAPNDGAPLSPAQQRLWFLNELDPDNRSYNISLCVRIRGELDVSLLARSIECLAHRHTILRTRFPSRDGSATQIVDDPAPFELPVARLAGPDVDEAALMAEVRSEINRSFDLANGPVFRARVFALDVRDHVLVVTFHHIVCDGWSKGIFARELGSVYRALRAGKDIPLAPLELQYHDFAVWQNRWLTTDALGSQLAYWVRQLEVLPTLDLPASRPRPRIQTHAGAEESLIIERHHLDGLHRLGRAHESTLFMCLLAALASVLHRHSGKDDIVIGSPVAGRNHEQIEDLIGFFINTLVLRFDTGGNPTFAELLEQARRVSLDAFDNQDVVFEKVVEAIDPQRDMSRNPLFQVFFNLVNVDTSVPDLGDAEVSAIDTGLDWSNFDLTLYAIEEPGQLTLRLNYNTDLFDAATTRRYLVSMQMLIAAVVESPERTLWSLPLGDPPTRTALRECLQGPRRSDDATARGRSLVSRFTEQVKLRGDAPAVVSEEQCWSYDELDRRSSQVAATLMSAEMTPGSRIALLYPHGAGMLAAVLGVLKAGCCYVPLDVLDPPARRRAIVGDSGARAILTVEELREPAASGAGEAVVMTWEGGDGSSTGGAVLPPRGPESLAYILYTSGTTGEPKGVLQVDAGVIHHADAYARSIALGHADRCTLLSSCTHDAGVVDIFSTLLTGAALCPFDLRSADSSDAASLWRWIATQGITVYHSTPTVFRHGLQCDDRGRVSPQVRCVVLGGEAMSWADHQLFSDRFSDSTRLLNLYGSTESSFSIGIFLDHDAVVNSRQPRIGLPVVDTDIVLLAPDGCATEVLGEIGVVSRYVAHGYWRRKILSAQHFVPQADGRTLYRTGDLGYQHTDGALEFVGRIDAQLKLRGLRIEPSEIEAALVDEPGIVKAVVTLRDGAGGEPYLAAYVVADGAFDEDAVRRRLALRLPPHMLPARITAIESVPMTAGGKVNMKALQARGKDTGPGRQGAVPTSDTERRLCAIWCEVLGLEQVSTDDDFFALGGHSLNATQMVSRIREQFGVTLRLREFFQRPKITLLSGLLEGQADQRIDVIRPVDFGEPDEELDGLSDAEVEALLGEQLRHGYPGTGE